MTILGKDDSYEDDGLKTTFPILVVRTSKGHGELRIIYSGGTVVQYLGPKLDLYVTIHFWKKKKNNLRCQIWPINLLD